MKTRTRWFVLLAVSAALTIPASLAVALVMPAYEVPMVERRLTYDAVSQTRAVISGTKVVYFDNRSGNNDVYCYDLATGAERQLSSNTLSQTNAAVSGNKVVYTDYRNGNPDVYLWDLTTGQERPLATNTSQQLYPKISGAKVVYADDRNGNFDIYLYDLATGQEKQLTTDTSSQTLPEISGGKVVYQDYRHGGAEIYCYDLVTGQEKRLTYDPAAQLQPAISGNTVVYEDLRNGDSDIYAYDMATNTEKRLTYAAQNDWGPSVSGTKVVYHSVKTAGANDIYCYDLSTDTEWRLTTDPGSQAPASIDGNTVAFIDSRFGGQEVGAGELATPRITASAPSVVAYGARAKLTGSLSTFSGLPLAWRTVLLETSTDGLAWTVAGSATTNSGGGFSLTSPALTSAKYLRANFGGSGNKAYLSAQSSARLVKPKVYLTRPSFGRTKLRYRKTYTAKGYLKPRHGAGNTQVKIKAYRYSRGKYRYKKTYTATASNYYSYSKYSKRIKLPKKGKWRLRAYHATDSQNAATYSSWRYVTVK